MSDMILKAENLQFSYDDGERYSLSGVNLEIQRGKKIAVMGANGSGKSTFFLCCNGIHRPSAGTLYFDGAPVGYGKKQLLDLRGKVGIVFQDPDQQLFSASVYQEISFGILNRGANTETARAAVEQVMEELAITPFAHRPTHALSGGEKKLVSIGDILVMEPQLVILDEPATGLDPRHRAMVREVVEGLTSRGITVMMATHDVDYAFGWADEILLFHGGRVLTQGTPLTVFSDPELLEQTNLAEPVVLSIYRRLVERGILAVGTAVPTDVETLLELL